MIALVSNIPHYYYAARALSRQGALCRYITTWCLLGDERTPRYLPQQEERKLEGRRFPEILSGVVDRLNVPEAVQKILPRIRLASPSQATNLANILFDRKAATILRRSDSWNVLHVVMGMGVRCMKEARKRRALIVCDCRQEHPSVQAKAVNLEMVTWGAPAQRRRIASGDQTIEELEYADELIVPSEYAKRTFVEYGFSGNRIHVAPYGTNTTRFASSSKKDKGSKLRLLFVGTLCLRKGILNLLEALRQVNSTGVSLTCIGAVDASMSTILRKYDSLFTHYPSVANIDLPRFYSQADLFILPSVADAYPLVVLEALSAGLPVVATTSVGSSELIRDGVEGVIIPPSNVEAIKTVIQRFLDEPDLANEMRSNVLQMRSRLAWTSYEQSIQDVYASLGARG